jgi:opacity protein-like surface antigen
MKRVGFPQAAVFAILILCLHQRSTCAQGIFEGGFVMGFPINDFHETSPNVLGIGFNASVMTRPDYSIFAIGGSVNYMLYGQDRRDEEVLLDDGTIVDGELINNSNMIQIHAIGRLQPDPDGGFPILPYVEGLVGANFVYTNSKVKVDFQDEALGKRNESLNATWSLGWAAGISINFDGSMLLDLKFKHLRTGQVKYLTNEDISYDLDTRSLVVQKRKSTLDMYMPQIGLTFFFD